MKQISLIIFIGILFLLMPISLSYNMTLNSSYIIEDTFVSCDFFYIDCHTNLVYKVKQGSTCTYDYFRINISSIPSNNITNAYIHLKWMSGGGSVCDHIPPTHIYNAFVDNETFDMCALTQIDHPCYHNQCNNITDDTVLGGIIGNLDINITNALRIAKTQGKEIINIVSYPVNPYMDCAVAVNSKDTDPYNTYIFVEYGEPFNQTYPPTTTTTIPSYPANAKIVGYSFSETNPILNQEIKIKIKIKNIGDYYFNFPIGLSIGDFDTGVFCNRDCYTDGKGDYVYTGNIAPQETVEIERKFRFNPSYFNEHQHYDTIIAVYTQPYLPPSNALDKVILNDNIYISSYVDKVFAYPYSVHVDKPKVSTGDIITVKSYIINNNTLPYNFTLGMSLGIWDAQNGKVYTSHRPSLIPACNLECYTDGKGDWVYLVIPPNYTAPFDRQFKIPDYFLNENYFDVAIGVWTHPPDEGGKLISITYFKNVSYVTTQPSTEVATGNLFKTFINSFLTSTSIALGTNTDNSKIVLWGLFNLVIIGLTIYYSGKLGIQTNMIVLVLSILLITSFVGMMIGWIPLVLGVIMILALGLILFKMIIG